MRKGKFLLPLAASLAIFGSMAFAATGDYSYARIYPNSTGVDGSIKSMSNYVDVSGANYSNATEDLWVELYQSVTGPDLRVNGLLVYPGKSINFTELVNSGSYYIHLDPDGSYHTGSDGWGKALD